MKGLAGHLVKVILPNRNQVGIWAPTTARDHYMNNEQEFYALFIVHALNPVAINEKEQKRG